MKQFKFQYNYKGEDNWVIITAEDEEQALRKFVYSYMYCEMEELE